jgi:hypothetical protein
MSRNSVILIVYHVLNRNPELGTPVLCNLRQKLLYVFAPNTRRPQLGTLSQTSPKVSRATEADVQVSEARVARTNHIPGRVGILTE